MELMELESGWIKTYRQIQEHWIWTSREPYDMRSAWQYLLMNANFSDNKVLMNNGELITVKRGQILVSVRNLSEKWKWSVSKTSKFLKRLEEDKMVQRLSNKSGTLLTIVNYGFYQDGEYTKDTPNDTPKRHQRDTEQYTEDTPKRHDSTQNKESKNIRNNKDNNIPLTPLEDSQGKAKEPKQPQKKETQKQMLDRLVVEFNISDYLLEYINNWLAYKKERNFTYKAQGLKTLIKMISQHARQYGDESVADVIEKSISSGYHGIVFDMLWRNKSGSSTKGSIDWDKV